MRKLSQKKSALALFCAGAALLLLLLGSLTGILPLLLALLALIAIVPLKDGLRYGIAVWLLVSAVSLLIPGKKDSTLIFALFGYYPLVRDRIASCKSRALRSGIRHNTHNRHGDLFRNYTFLPRSAPSRDSRQPGPVTGRLSSCHGNILPHIRFCYQKSLSDL